MPQLIVLAHGIGDARDGFHQEWEKVIARNHDLSDVTVKGLWWEDVLSKVAERYPVVSASMAELVEMCGFPNLKKWAGSKNARIFEDYMMDVLVYAGLNDMWLHIQNECALKLDALRRDGTGNVVYAKDETILVGHSLGAAMLPHVVWRECAYSGVIPYRGMILLASPLGFESPFPHICQDFLQRMGVILGGDRLRTLKLFARIWNMAGKNRLKFVCNENDIVCSDVKYEIPATGALLDLIPLRQGLSPAEIHTLNSELQDCVEIVSFGKAEPRAIVANHSVLTYLAQKPFNDALGAMLS